MNIFSNQSVNSETRVQNEISDQTWPISEPKRQRYKTGSVTFDNVRLFGRCSNTIPLSSEMFKNELTDGHVKGFCSFGDSKKKRLELSWIV